MSDNPLLAAPTLPYDLPDWSRIEPDHYLEAITEGMRQQREAISAITRVRSVGTFENTIEAWERSGELLSRAAFAFYTVSSADASDEIQAIEETLAPLFAAHTDAIMQDSMLYARVRSIADNAAQVALLTDEQRYLLKRRLTEMSRAGAALDEQTKAHVASLNARLASLGAEFDRRLLADTNARAPRFTEVEALAGMTADDIATAASDDGSYRLSLPLYSGHPLLEAITNRDTRATIMAASLARGTAGEHETWSVLLETVRLRAERAALLGYDSHAAYVTADETAGSPDAVTTLLRQLAPAAARNAANEADALQGLIDAREEEPYPLTAADWAYWTERRREAELDVDTAALRPWFEAERVLQDGVFFAATKLYGVTFQERTDLHGYHADVRVFEVFEADGTPLGLYLLDLYTRDTKRGGAWMNEIVAQNDLFGTAPVVMNNLNVVKPASGPTLLTFDETETLFHEFGHALHGLFAKVTYPTLAGTNVFRDFVEFPSQVNEMWMLWPEVLDNYAKHVETGETIDAAVIDRIRGAEAFNQGHATSEYLQAAWLDFAWHSLTSEAAASVNDPLQFQQDALADIGLRNDVIPTRYASTYFQHVFSGGYSAGYYSYIWSEVMDADTVQWFKQNGGLSRAGGDRFRTFVLAEAGKGDPRAAYRRFRGADPDIQALLDRRGLNTI